MNTMDIKMTITAIDIPLSVIPNVTKINLASDFTSHNPNVIKSPITAAKAIHTDKHPGFLSFLILNAILKKHIKVSIVNSKNNFIFISPPLVFYFSLLHSK